MDYYQGVVLDYLRADRAIFINAECCIQLNEAHNPDSSGPHWYCDAVACDFRERCIFLCEISYSSQLADLVKRLRQWHENWQGVRDALTRDSHVPPDWPVRPWLFVPEGLVALLIRRLQINHGPAGTSGRFTPRITTLEAVQPWLYSSWNRTGEKAKPNDIPLAIRS
jgi:hypothetical protein